MRIVVTGAGGGVGRALREAAPAHHEIEWLAHDDLSVEDRHAVMQRVAGADPDVILHLAAETKVDDCERDPDAAYRANALGTANVALAARETGALLVALSTDYVFDGTKGEPYHEFDRPNPISVYGTSKLAGEEEARALAPDHLIVRTAWVFGGGDDFVTGAVRRLASGEEVAAIVDLHGTPTYVRHLAERLFPLAVSGLRGVVHLGGPERTTFFDLLARARGLGGLPGTPVEQKDADLGRPA
ncbi:MAG TPA: NAD(P)-dependent oxidoreductase, partial [Actinomycetota bacterium]